jgi:NAD dependent epimerase/dehydratase family enzyme
MNQVLIIGSDGLIGNALAARISSLGQDVTVTTRRAETRNTPNLMLDLSSWPEAWPEFPDEDT